MRIVKLKKSTENENQKAKMTWYLTEMILISHFSMDCASFLSTSLARPTHFLTWLDLSFGCGYHTCCCWRCCTKFPFFSLPPHLFKRADYKSFSNDIKLYHYRQSLNFLMVPKVKRYTYGLWSHSNIEVTLSFVNQGLVFSAFKFDWKSLLFRVFSVLQTPTTTYSHMWSVYDPYSV